MDSINFRYNAFFEAVPTVTDDTHLMDQMETRCEEFAQNCGPSRAFNDNTDAAIQVGSSKSSDGLFQSIPECKIGHKLEITLTKSLDKVAVLAKVVIDSQCTVITTNPALPFSLFGKSIDKIKLEFVPKQEHLGKTVGFVMRCDGKTLCVPINVI